MTAITLSNLTDGELNGKGIFDQLMVACKAHLEAEFKKGAIKGPEYAQVYLGQVQSVMQTALQFISLQSKIGLEADLLAAQVALANAQLAQTQAQTDLVKQQVANALVEKSLIEAKVAQAAAEKAQTEAQTAMIGQQQANLVLEASNIPLQGLHLKAQTSLVDQQLVNAQAEKLQTEAQTQLIGQQKANLIVEQANMTKQGDQLVAQTALTGQQKKNLELEAANIPKQGAQIEAQTTLVTQQKENAAQEKLNLVAQECLLKAQYNNTMQGIQKGIAETSLLAQKTVTEKAQTMAIGVDEDSIIGRQKQLYAKQAAGFDRDSEQKVAKIMIDTWNVRRTTDEGTVADGTNKLNDATIGRAVDKMLVGVGA